MHVLSFIFTNIGTIKISLQCGRKTGRYQPPDNGTQSHIQEDFVNHLNNEMKHIVFEIGRTLLLRVAQL